MQKQKPIIETSLSERADERERSDQLRNMTKAAAWLVGLGLVVSAVLTVFYLTLLVNDAAAYVHKHTSPAPSAITYGFRIPGL
jgi:hypothetical protein